MHYEELKQHVKKEIKKSGVLCNTCNKKCTEVYQVQTKHDAPPSLQYKDEAYFFKQTYYCSVPCLIAHVNYPTLQSGASCPDLHRRKLKK